MDETTNLTCVICNSTHFTVNDGYYFCTECGTQSKAVRAIEIDHIHSASKVTRLKIKKEKRKEAETTTWECFNYLLRGLVEELTSLGAKDELKFTVLQLWSTYLKKSEIAFFNNKRTQLPKLGPCYSERDAKILFNHEITKRRKRNKSCTESEISGNLSSRQLGKRKKKFATAEYEKLSGSSMLNSSTSRFSSSTGTTTRAIRLSFTNTARKIFKRSIPKLHIEKHEEDSIRDLECHKLKRNKTTLPRKVWEEQLTRRTIYTILYLALNLIEDDIQLSDMLRYMHEGHISTSKIQQFFPENIAEDCTKIINSREFISKRLVYLHISIRQRAVVLCRYLGVKDLKIPDLTKLTNRYCHDLNLPIEIATYCERLINLCPPKMEVRFEAKQTPCFEGRAIAYIIFILKLIFGLDGYTETCLSNSARSINKILQNLNITTMLFVWEDWVKYIEMRNLILADRHLATSIQSKSNISQQHYIEHIIAENAHCEESIVKSKRVNFRNMNKIFNDLYERTKNSTSQLQLSEFHSTLTPHTDYYNIISSNNSDNIFIPKFMKRKFNEHDIHSFLNPFKLKEMLHKYSFNLHITKIECPNEIKYVKPFQHLDGTIKKSDRDIGVRKVEFNINESEWLENIKNKHNFTTDEFLIANYRKCKKNKLKTTKKENLNNSTSFSEPTVKKKNLSLENIIIFETDSLGNNDDENSIIKSPRRNLETSDIFVNLSDFDDDDDNDDNDNNNSNNDDNDNDINNLKFFISNSEYWTLFGKMINITSKQFDEVKKNFPLSFLWLLEHCSKYLQIDIEDIYQELLIIENKYLYGLGDLNEMKDILILNNAYENVMIQRFAEHYNKMW